MVHETGRRLPVDDAILMRFGLFTDTHYSAGVPNTLDGVAILDAISAIYTRFEQAGVNIYMHLGDSVEDYVEADIDTLLTAISSGKLYIAPGTHDDDSGADDFAGYVNTNHSDKVAAECFADGLPYYSFDKGDGHCIVLDASTSGDETNPYTLSPTQTAWLEADLLANADKKIVVFLHPRCSGVYAAGVTLKMYEDGAGGAAALRAVLEAAGNVVMVVNGHEHSYHFGKVGGIWYLNVNSVYSNSNHCAIVTVWANGDVAVQVYGAGVNPWISRR
jgi:predicted phosphodiesterase